MPNLLSTGGHNPSFGEGGGGNEATPPTTLSPIFLVAEKNFLGEFVDHIRRTNRLYDAGYPFASEAEALGMAELYRPWPRGTVFRVVVVEGGYGLEQDNAE